MSSTSLAASISSTGIAVPSYATIFAALQSQMQSIYGSDIVITPDSQDGQMLAIMAAAINNSNQAAVAVYNQFSPSTAQGAGLSSIVKINGLQRITATYSTAVVLIVGQAGTVITNGVISDSNSTYLWSLPASVTIPTSGQSIVTATCQALGAIAAAANTLTLISTPTRGWQTVTNPNTATPGTAVETDAQLRARQSISTSLPAQSPFTSIVAAVANVPGVTKFMGYENFTGVTDSNGIPGHSVSMVVGGGDSTAIATAIALKKTPGTGTYGTTNIVVTDSYGIPKTINYFSLAYTNIYVSVIGTALNGYVSTAGTTGIASVVSLINGLAVGQTVYQDWVLAAAQMVNTAIGQTFKITSLTIGLAPGVLGSADLPIAFNATAYCVTANVTWTVS